MQTKENSFFKNVIASIKDFEKYPEMATKPFRKVCKYLITLIAIFTLIVTALSVYEVSKELNNGIDYIKNEMPNLTFSNNKLTVDTEKEIKIYTNSNIIDLFIIDTNNISNEQINNYTSEIENYNSGIIFLSDKLIINLGNGTMTYTYEKLAESYNIGDMTKDSISNYLSGSNIMMIYVGIYIMSFIYLFIEYLISIITDIIILAIIGYITSLLMKVRIRYMAMIKIVMHALTLPIILNLVYIALQSLFAFEIKYFGVMYITIAYIYIVASILMIKSDIIKRGQELAKIVEEEQKVREDLERKKQEEKEKEEEEKRQRENEKNKKKKEKKADKEDDLGPEPQGENA